MKIASVADVKAKLSEYVRSADTAPVVITRNGKAVAAIVPLTDDDDIERLLLGYSPKLRKILAKGREQGAGGETISHDEFWGTQASPKRRGNRRQS
jgi:prevent-host-death family protein